MKALSKAVTLALAGGVALSFVFGASSANATNNGKQTKKVCKDLPTHAELEAALRASLPANAGGTLTTANDPAGLGSNGGLDIPMWASIVARDGIVCAVAFSGSKFDDQWPASRAIAGQKANATNGLTTNASASAAGIWSTALLYSAVQPGASLFGLQESNPVNPEVAYKGPSARFGQDNDPLVGQRIGGINVFGGGLALFDSASNVIGGLGVSGDTSCADHNVAWRVRTALGLDHNPKGPQADNLIFQGTTGAKSGLDKLGLFHPFCLDPVKELTDLNAITGDAQIK